jgi:iron complex transport system substrate-binding protein
MNETYSIYGVSGVQNISNSKILSDVNEGKVKDVGYEINLNYETILSIRPDVIFAYCIGGEATGYIKKLKDLGLNVVLVGEYLEQEPLARTEWAVFFSTFFNKDNEVKVGFDSIANEYNRLKLITDTLSVKPTILTSMPFKDTWWIPGGKSYVSKLINDAGGNYVWDDNESKESIPLNIESVFFKASKSDIWINVDNINSPEDLLKVDSRLGKFDAFKNCKVYSNNARMNMNGANDYWESGTIYPQLILKDLISIFHPNIVSNHQMYYYKNICNN